MEELLAQILEGVKTRDYRKGFGIGRAVAYLKQFSGDAFTQEMAKSPDEWAKALEEAESALTYHDWKMRVGKVKDAGSLPEGACATFDCVITSTRKDRDGDVLEAKGATLDPRMPLLWMHNMLQPIGRFESEGTRNAKQVSGSFAVMDFPLGRDAAALAKFGALRISHGFVPTDMEPLEDEEKGYQDGWHIHKYDVHEASLVSVPSNVDAEILGISGKSYEKEFAGPLDGIRTAVGKGILKTDMVREWAQTYYDNRPAQASVTVVPEPDEVKAAPEDAADAAVPRPATTFCLSGEDESKDEAVPCEKCAERESEDVAFDATCRAFIADAISSNDETSLKSVVTVVSARLKQLQRENDDAEFTELIGV